MQSTGTLALLGGQPVRQKDFASWPRADKNTELNLLEVLYSQRWAISGPYTGAKSFERRFAEAYAAFHKVQYCVPTANGSSAITIALEAVDVRAGDEVLVPGLTWVACASAVAGIGAIPIIVDVEPETLCMSLPAARQAITARTRAILLVHQFCTIADIAGFVQLAAEHNLPLIEDCSQAHGAQWQGRRVGTFGVVGVASMQQTKVLTSGEGGAAITNDPYLYDRMQQLRADGRRYTAQVPAAGEMELEEIGSVQGRNYCLSEFQSAILLDRLPHLDTENHLREQNAAYLLSLLSTLGGVTGLARRPGTEQTTYYHFCVRLQREAFGQCSIEAITHALTAELGILIEPVDTPLNKNILYNPLNSPRTAALAEIRAQFDPTRFHLPNADEARSCCLTIPHRVLLGDHADMESIAAGFAKVQRYSHELSCIDQERK